MFDYAERRRRLSERMRADGVDLLFVGLSADLEYLSGAERAVPNFGQSSYAHGWVAGGFFRPDADPVFVLPRMARWFELGDWEPPGELVVVNETDDGPAIFERVVRGLGSPDVVAVGDRVWAETLIHLGNAVGFDKLRTGSALVNELRRVKSAEELETMTRAAHVADRVMAAVTSKVVPGVSMLDLLEEVEHQLFAQGSRTPSFATHIFTGMEPDDFDSGTASARAPIPDGTSVMFDFGAVVDGYCSDFGRTIYCGDPPTTTARSTTSCSPPRRRAGRRRRRARSRATSTRPAGRRSRTQGSASTSATAWVTGSGSTSTSSRSSRPRTRPRSRPA